MSSVPSESASSGAEVPVSSGTEEPLSAGAEVPVSSGAQEPLSAGAEVPLSAGKQVPLSAGVEPPAPSGADELSAGSDAVTVARRRRNPLIYFWVYSLARVTLYLVLWGLLWLFGLGGLIGAAVALLLSVPLSFVLLARPRAAMTGSMMERLNVRQERTAALDQELSGGPDPELP